MFNDFDAQIQSDELAAIIHWEARLDDLNDDFEE